MCVRLGMCVCSETKTSVWITTIKSDDPNCALQKTSANELRGRIHLQRKTKNRKNGGTNMGSMANVLFVSSALYNLAYFSTGIIMFRCAKFAGAAES